LRNNIKN